jgi:hypothetical protein
MRQRGNELSSRALRDCAPLQACLNHDSAHITTGATGPHVLRVQQVLTLLGEVPLSQWHAFTMEAKAQRYGPCTASVVLSYKRKRRIINSAYQTQADNIVGKMTIRALDDDMVAYEQRRHLC